MVSDVMKTCARCGITKPTSEFNANKSRADGLQHNCKVCRKVINAETYERTKDIHRNRRAEINARHTLRNQAFTWEYLKAHPCVDCGEPDPIVLQFDHQRDKVVNVARLIRGGSLDRLVAEMEKCEVVCANCHSRRTAKTYGWWKTKL